MRLVVNSELSVDVRRCKKSATLNTYLQEIANAIVFLSRGDRCGFLNGHVLAIDGGALCS
jgi:hypothetical protein